MMMKDSWRRHFHASLTLAALVFIFVALVIPNRISWITLQSFAFFPLEILLLGLALLIPGRPGFAIRLGAAFLLAAGIIFKAADLCAYQIFSRPFDPVFDAYLLEDGVHLLTGAIGRFGAMIAVILLALVLAGIFVASYRILGRLQAQLQLKPQAYRTILAGGLLLWIILASAGWPRTSTYFYDLLAEHASSTITSLADLREFQQVVNIDTYADTPGDRLFTALKGKDVVVLFVESYGRTTLDKPEFAAHIRPVLEQGSKDLAAHNILSRSAYLTSPTAGGISWLAHGTLLSGLWINSQVRYDSLVMSERPSLNRLFKRAGWRTVTLQPAHTMPWPEGAYFGYDQVYSAHDLGYKGQPFNWITMPDQYTLSAFQARERSPGARAPVMAEIALISSHAPWTPLPHLVDWNQVGDGTVFTEQALAGDAPETVWQDNARIREQYRKSIEYALANIISYAITYGDDNLVLLVLGDHQPTPLVTGDSDNRDVPVHLISRDPTVIKAMDGWHWSEGLVPADKAPVWKMDEVRNRLITTFSP